MNRMYIKFQDIPMRAVFFCNGNQCQKVSTRTARLIEYGRTFYFSQRELCVVGEYCALKESSHDIVRKA